MQQQPRALSRILATLIAFGILSGLAAGYKRFHIEQRNRKVEIALEWPEIVSLSQASQEPVSSILSRFKAAHVSTLAIPEDTLSSLEIVGTVQPQHTNFADGQSGMEVQIATEALMKRLRAALAAHNIATADRAGEFAPPVRETEFVGPGTSSPTTPDTADPSQTTLQLNQPLNHGRFNRRHDEAFRTSAETLFVPMDYPTIRTLGIGLPDDAIAAAEHAGLRIAARIGNFPGVSDASATAVLRNLRIQSRNITTVIFIGDDVLGYRGLEKRVADLLRQEPNAPTKSDPNPLAPVELVYGAVEFGKQRGDEKLSAALHGDFVRVHSIQSAEMATMEDDEAIDRYVKAVRERNIRFCYVRMITFAGNDPVLENERYLIDIAKGMAHGSVVTGGDLGFGPAKRYDNTNVSPILFAILGIGAAAGTVWMICLFFPPLEDGHAVLLLLVLAFLFSFSAWRFDETGRKIVALVAGIAFPTAACIATWPRPTRRPLRSTDKEDNVVPQRSKTTPDFVKSASSRAVNAKIPVNPIGECLSNAVKAITLASAITTVGIIHVIGLLATRPFMLHASQFMGIKAQHAIPLLLVAAVALMGGVIVPGETRKRFKARTQANLTAAMNEPARFGALIVGIVALSVLVLIVARTGNDAGVGVSSFELKGRAILDRIMPVRPRTKEFLLGHPLFLLGIAWWYRGRRRLAIPCLVGGSIGQASLLNTFCHIHTPLIVSFWRGFTGLVLGAIIGMFVFWIVEKLAPVPSNEITE